MCCGSVRDEPCQQFGAICAPHIIRLELLHNATKQHAQHPVLPDGWEERRDEILAAKRITWEAKSAFECSVTARGAEFRGNAYRDALRFDSRMFSPTLAAVEVGSGLRIHGRRCAHGRYAFH